MQAALDEELKDYRAEKNYTPPENIKHVVKAWHKFRQRHNTPLTYGDVANIKSLYGLEFTAQDVDSMFMLEGAFSDGKRDNN